MADKFYQTTVEVKVLSDRPISNLNLVQIAHSGDLIGTVEFQPANEVPPETMAKLLEKRNYDRTFLLGADCTPDQRHIAVEYDINHWGGDYSDVGMTTYIPADLIAGRFGDNVETAFSWWTGLQPVHIVRIDQSGYFTADGEPFEEDEETEAEEIGLTQLFLQVTCNNDLVEGIMLPLQRLLQQIVMVKFPPYFDSHGYNIEAMREQGEAMNDVRDYLQFLIRNYSLNGRYLNLGRANGEKLFLSGNTINYSSVVETNAEWQPLADYIEATYEVKSVRAFDVLHLASGGQASRE
ncbi:hypothetical protein H6G00_01875 [Leptolyngbya sp. FACHB-541]|uniref:hypothetical protein n=1 Tax=Leptolyngbya sp. FACHB-541 TaxID=2692810 RepID=UPI00168417A3|nr:hypothetical protein [Leptolyngbya sp. FACHB-541]MBD1995380.1 hypothetical protein [Leptolyngbya sp. FACHB-541]